MSADPVHLRNATGEPRVGPWDEQPPLTWRRVVTYDGLPNPPIVVCEHGHASPLHPDHQIADDGTVTPSILNTGCGWHVYAVLDGWKGP